MNPHLVNSHTMSPYSRMTSRLGLVILVFIGIFGYSTVRAAPDEIVVFTDEFEKKAKSVSRCT